MKTVSSKFLIEDSPCAVAILDVDMRFIAHSKIWQQEFTPDFDSIIGHLYYDILPNTPEALREMYSECLQGASILDNGIKFILPNGSIQWLNCKINHWKDEKGMLGGLMIMLEDVTETKRREELLLKAEQVARIGGWEVDMTTNKVYWTEVTKEIHEVAKNFTPTIEQGINFYKEGESRDTITLLFSEALANGTPWDTELMITTAKGKELWVRARGEAEMVNGKCSRIYGTFQDIDDQKKFALNYKEVTDKLTAATVGANFGIFNFDIVNNVLTWDESMYRIYGVKEEDFSGEFEAWRSGLHADDIERCDNEVAMSLSGEKSFDSEFRIIWPNGEVRHIRGIVIIQRDAEGNAIKMIGTNWDVTELKNTQLELKKSQDSFSGAFENSNTGMALVGLDDDWIKVNQSLCNSLGYTEDELMQTSFKDISHPDDYKASSELLQELKNNERQSFQIEKRYYHKKGHLIYAILMVTAVRNIEGELSHFVKQVMDISHRKIAEKKMSRMVEVTSEQNESLLNFAHIVSHNLRSHSSNLSMLSGFLSTEENETERKNLLRMLVDASESLNETVLHLNEVVQVKVGAIDKMKRVNLRKTIKNVKKNLGLLLKDKNTSCTMDIPENLTINAIPAYVDSILLNLFTNSIKYSSPERPPKIVISTENIANHTVLTFSDNGLGIDLKRHGKKLFGMYKTFHRNKDAKGIGLFITKNQIEAMNGRIEVESKVDVGTTFKLYFESAAA
ncbi:MAG TPA: PAS domain S-box protein [Pricia antarctica]|uniref:histidine kinase n=2 Tax=root TaxID=1 RepID=A0A831QRU7_9FLAO|nr:PAS domain S-box protein [Pricia antarctica]